MHIYTYVHDSDLKVYSNNLTSLPGIIKNKNKKIVKNAIDIVDIDVTELCLARCHK